jgi:hypothetical protein
MLKRYLSKEFIIGACVTALVLVPILTVVGVAAVTQIAGLAVAGPNNAWYNVKDAGRWTDPQSNGFLSQVNWLYTGTNFVRQQGTSTGRAFIVPDYAGTGFATVKRDNITTASVNFSFGFTSKKVALEFPLTNTDEICIDWTGGTAVCPAANTAGDDRFAPGDSIILDEYAVTSVSVIAASGTQTVYIRAWQ